MRIKAKHDDDSLNKNLTRTRDFAMNKLIAFIVDDFMLWFFLFF